MFYCETNEKRNYIKKDKNYKLRKGYRQDREEAVEEG